MEKKSWILKVFIELDDVLYKKGMSKITIPINGIRKNNYSDIDRKVILNHLLNKKNKDIFLKEFCENIKQEICEFGENEEFRNFLENREWRYITCENYKYIYLYCVSRDEYKDIVKYLAESDFKQTEEIKDISKNPLIKENEFLKQMNAQMKKELQELRRIEKERKEKLQNLNMAVCLKDEEITRLRERILELEEAEKVRMLKPEDKKIVGMCGEENEFDSKNIAIIGIRKNIVSCNIKNVVCYTKYEMEKFENSSVLFDEIYVIKSELQIGQLRKLKKSKLAIFVENENEMINILKSMEEAK